MSGREIRLRRIFPPERPRLFAVPLDHSVSMGPIEGLEATRSVAERLQRGGADLLIVAKGAVRDVAPVLRASTLLGVHVSASTALSEAPDAKVLVGSAEEAVALGADLLSVQVNFGPREEGRMLSDLGVAVDQCRKLGLPLLCMAYVKRGPPASPDELRHAARAVADLGADIVKTSYPGTTEELRRMVRTTPVPVLLGGGLKEGSDATFLRQVRDAMSAGAAGLCAGRNLFQRGDPEPLARKVAAIVHRGAAGMIDADRVVVAVVAATASERTRLATVARSLGFPRGARRSGRAYRIDGEPRALRPIDVRLPTDLAAAVGGSAPGELRLLRWAGDRIIPLENALARSDRGRRIAVLAGSPDEIPGALGALERGADLVVIEIGTAAELHQLARRIERPPVATLRWRSVPVTRVEPAGTSDRVLVDTTRLLHRREGLVVGSAARFLFAVASEAEGSTFSRPRAFRVNAGAPHSYVLLADGSTRYLSELVPGDRLLVVRPGAAPTTARVGRLKIERRPMLLVEAARKAPPPTIFLQEAETVRLMERRGNIPVTKLTPGRRLLGVELAPARHLGAVVEESIEER